MNKLYRIGVIFFCVGIGLYLIPILLNGVGGIIFSSLQSHMIAYALLISFVISAFCLSTSNKNLKPFVESMIVLDVLFALSFGLIGFGQF